MKVKSTLSLKYRSGRAGTFFLGLFSLCLLLMLLLQPMQGLEGARVGLALCAEVIIPSLFPFLAFSSFVINVGLAGRCGRILEPLMRRLFRLPGAAAAALVLGVIGGYPVGAKACADLYRKNLLTRKEANRLLSFCINSSPAFIIGAVGTGLLRSAGAGMLLYCAHIAASLAIGLISGLFAKILQNEGAAKGVKGTPPAAALVAAVTGSASAIVNICGFVILFSSLSSMLGAGCLQGLAGIISRLTGGRVADAGVIDILLKGLLEVSNGCAAAAGIGMPHLLATSALLSWSGLSVICQVMYAVSEAGLSVKHYVLSRFGHMAISVGLSFLLFTLFPPEVPAASITGKMTCSLHSAPASAALLIFCVLLLLSQVTV